MIKKIFYALFFMSFLGLIAFFFYNKLKNKLKPEEEIITATTQTIIPAVSAQVNNIDGSGDTIHTSKDANVFLELYNDEIFVDSLSADLNSDGVEDQIIAVKKILDPFLYLIISIQNQAIQRWERTEEIRTSITQPKSLSFYTMELHNSLPAIVYSGMSSDNGQTLSIQSLSLDKDNKLKFEQIADLHADVQIELKISENISSNIINENQSLINSFAAYKIYTYSSDPKSPNTLNQIQTEYYWNEKINKYEKGREIEIPGEKIETQLLRKLQAGNMESYIEFLSGLWHIPSSGKNINQNIYLDKTNNIIIFSIDNTQEVYEITSTLPRRYGLFFTTTNKSIPNIVRRVDIEIKAFDEIQVRVIESVARIKFATDSLWNGTYKKFNDYSQVNIEQRSDKTKQIKDIFTKQETEWNSSSEDYIYFNKNKYSLTLNNSTEKGFFNIIEVKDLLVLQTKNEKKQTSFYIMEFLEENKKQTISLTKINLNINDIQILEDEPIIFVRDFK